MVLQKLFNDKTFMCSLWPMFLIVDTGYSLLFVYVQTVPACQNLYKNSFTYHCLQDDQNLPFDDAIQFLGEYHSLYFVEPSTSNLDLEIYETFLLFF